MYKYIYIYILIYTCTYVRIANTSQTHHEMLENANCVLLSPKSSRIADRPGHSCPHSRWRESDQPETTNIMNLQQAGDFQPSIT